MFEDLIPELQAPAEELLRASGQAGLQPRVTSTRRTGTQQARLYRRWLAGQSPFPAAPPGTSAHEYGYAFDLVCTPMEALEDVGYTWGTWGGVWGPGDPIHFEYPGFVPPASDQPWYVGAGYSKTPVAAQLIGPLPWWSFALPSWIPTSFPDVLKAAVTVEKKLGVDAAINWVYAHVGQNPDKP